MRTISTLLAIAIVIMVTNVFTTAAIGGAQALPQETRTFQGTLIMVDADKYTLTVRAADAKEWVFTYTDETKVIGPAKDVEGLTGKPGANLKITYHIERLANRATQIEIVR